MQGINYATAVAGSVPGDYTQDYILASGSTGIAPPHQLQQHPGDDVREAVPPFSGGEGSDDGSYDHLQRHSGHEGRH